MAEQYHDPQAIVASEAFKAINLLLDAQAEELRAITFSFKGRVEKLIGTPDPYSSPYVETRVSYEQERPTSPRPRIELAVDPILLRELRWYFDEAERLQKSIGELQRYKLRLLNDYDFTHGDNTEQVALFGPPDVPSTPQDQSEHP